MILNLPPSADNNAIAAVQTLEEKLDGLFKLLTSEEATPASKECCPSGILNIEKYIPYWILKEKAERGGDVLTIFDFIQKYYDWLYCSSEVCGGSGYILEEKILEVIDIEKTKELYYKKIFFGYFGDFDETEQVKDVNGLVIDNQTVASFVKNIKTKFNLRKGSLESLQLFFAKLFSVDPNNITISYPKEQIFRLNGGAFSNTTTGFTGSNIKRGVLNYNRLQDGDWFQEYSYILHTGLTSDNYGAFYTRALHPIGLKLIIEKNITDYLVDGNTSETPELLQPQTIGHYSPYILGQTYAGESSYKLIIEGTTYYGVSYAVGCTLSGSSFGATASYVFPSWAIGMSYDKFTDIPINKMFDLFYSINTTNPNTQTC